MEDGGCIMMLFGACIGSGVGALVGKSKARQMEGALFGLLLGPLGWLIIALGPSYMPKCPSCKGDVIKGAVKCKNCGSDLPGTQAVQHN